MALLIPTTTTSADVIAAPRSLTHEDPHLLLAEEAGEHAGDGQAHGEEEEEEEEEEGG